MSANPQHHRWNYSRLETDDEFRARLAAHFHGAHHMYAGDRLDEHAWSSARMQRRIIWAP